MPSDDLFWFKVDKSGGPDACWPWTGSRNANGYGQVQRRAIRKGPLLASRYAYFLTHGRWPEHALHSCDNPPCCNPKHLRDGTQKDNIQDAIQRNRAISPPRNLGEAHPNSALLGSQVEEIRVRLASGERHRDIAKDFGVARTTITAINRGTNWGDS